MLGDTITVYLGGSGGTAKVLKKINQDNYSAEYLLRDATEEFRLKVRHSNEGGSNGFPFERHNVELTHRVFSTDTTPEEKRIVSMTIRNLSDDLGTDVPDLAAALTFWVGDTVVGQLQGLES